MVLSSSCLARPNGCSFRPIPEPRYACVAGLWTFTYMQRGEPGMPTVTSNGITLNYQTSGEGEPLVLLPYLAADQACYAFQVADYAKQFRCISVNPRGAGLSDKPEGTYTTELFADDIAAFMQALGLQQAHVAGLSLGAAIGIWLA